MNYSRLDIDMNLHWRCDNIASSKERFKPADSLDRQNFASSVLESAVDAGLSGNSLEAPARNTGFESGSCRRRRQLSPVASRRRQLPA